MRHRTIESLLLFGLFQTVFAFEEELQFVKGLTEEGFPRLAKTVLFRTLEEFPQASSAAPELRIRILIAEKNFSEAQVEIPNIGSPEPLWLFLAETAYTARQWPAAEAAYKEYFKTASTPNAQAAFNYGFLLEERGEEIQAILLYERVDSRPTQSRLASLLIESDPSRALTLAEEVQLGGLDLWFGQALITWAQLVIQKEEWGEAQAVLEMQLELLREMSASIAPAVAPIAGARYWLGICYEHEGKKAEALHQFYNVYAKQGSSEWGPKAHEKARELIAHFEGQGKTVQIDLGANLVQMEEAAFRVARRLFFDRKYAKAIPAYLIALNEFPEGSESITALRELTLSSIHLDDELSAKTFVHYLSERFVAGGALLTAGKAALDQKQESLAWWIYDRYLKSFPTHPRAPAVLYSLAGLRNEEHYLHRIVEDYPDSLYHIRALGRLAWNAFEAKDYETAAARFAPYVDTEPDLQNQTRARFAFAECYRNLNLWGAGLSCFQGLEKATKEAADRYGASKEALEFNQPFLEKAVYYQAVCQKEMGHPDEAVALCARFEKQFPTSGILEQVRFTKAKTLVESERFTEALIALKELGGKFAEPACYYRGVAQFETGSNEAAIQTLEKLLINWPASAFFFEAQFLQGRAYVAAGLRNEAVRVFGNILNVASDDLLIHRASLELGRAQVDPAEKLASFQRVALLADPENEAHAALIAAALFESLPLYLELARTDDLLADSDRLLATFPNVGKTKEINALKIQVQQMQKELTADSADENGSRHGK